MTQLGLRRIVPAIPRFASSRSTRRLSRDGSAGTDNVALVREFVKDHVALLVSLLAALTVVAKVWTVSHGEIATVVSMLSEAGTLTSVLGALTAGLPAMAAAPLFIVTAILPEAIREGDSLKGPLVGATAALLVAGALAPTGAVVIAGVLLLGPTAISSMIVAFRAIWHRATQKALWSWLEKSSNPHQNRLSALLIFLVVAAWGVGIANDRPWLPVEDITTGDGRTVTGYLLASDDLHLVVLLKADRSVVRIPEGDVTDQTICRLDDNDQRSLLSRLLWDRPDYPGCRGDAS